jgi:hypothetical protein
MPFSPWAVLAAAVVSFLVGGLWYSPLLFGKPWQRLVGLSDAELGTGMARVFGGSALLALLMAVNLAAFIGLAPGMAWAATAGALTGFGWVAPALAVVYLFERRPVGLILIDGGYHGVSFTLMGLVIGLLQ